MVSYTSHSGTYLPASPFLENPDWEAAAEVGASSDLLCGADQAEKVEKGD